MVGSAAVVYAHNDPVMSACHVARGTDTEIREILDTQLDALIEQIVAVVTDEISAGTAHPIIADVPALVRTLTATTAFMLSGDSAYLGKDPDARRGVGVLEQLWLSALWGGTAAVRD
jgi:hypothetical protein